MNRTQQPKKVSIKSIFSLCLVSIAFSVHPPVQAQIIPDSTLGTEASQLNQNQIIKDAPGDKIDGGATRGINLFHSFSEFNIQDGQRVYFANPTGVENILTRVTGRNGSNIFGTLGVAGAANLFLINPNGILFGQNASLDVQGSFVGTTANGVQFGNQQLFSATNPQIPSLLIVSVPVGLQYGQNPGEIQTQGASLKVLNGQTLTLAGGTVNIDGGQLLAPSGRVELAGVAALDEVGLTQQGQKWRLSLPDGLARYDVSLTNGAIVNGSGGSIAINARNVNILGTGTRLFARINPGLGSVGAKAGDIDVNAVQEVNIAVGGGVAGGIYSGTGRGSVGDSGNINITTGSLKVSGDGARIATPTFGGGKAGNINIVARDTVTFDGGGFHSVRGGVAVVSSVEEGAVNGGDINITTGSLNVIRGAQLNAITFGGGNAGNVNILARDTVTFDGGSFGSTGFSSTGSATAVTEEGTGNGGDINITTGSLKVTGGARLSANTFGGGNAGNVIINARDRVTFDGVASNGVTSRVTTNVTETGKGDGGDISINTGVLSLTNGGNIDAATYGQGNAGNINIAARDAVFFDGVDSDGFGSGAYSSVDSEASGQGGRITVNAGLFSIINKGILSVSSEGQGNAGDLKVNARQLLLDNQGSIVAQTASGEGGNITLKAPELLVLRRGSFISTTAGTAQSGGNGGNITFDGKFIVAIPNENTDISANAFTGTGGNIQINSQGIFGIESRPKPTDKSDITASSELGISGTINLNQPDNSSIQNSFTELSPNVIDTNALIANSCIARGAKRQENSFTITGSGALRNSPGDVLISTYTTGDVRSVESTSRPWKKGDPIIEPQGLYRLPDGRSLLSRACN
ncbi:hypothetical protein DSM106972_048210 [Dulcicalothrix desertica PCC 7102]|uniref:Filamentous haemagglutinin FhaB/tRNA nuclease CdiA-like TPS domain-containing protein n=1 Tax=Dulcicalothrix desertica PCC 7102 TaxID=232991 RepID=A0A3S1CBE1_9CYAN|nr:filamentous hemagglutinin N-terminal domain-containing protein [Dulcicalothrix desertica]RUT03907.1 hypothetical protein DSM106972_048210 [Dulcicalothrix desertica PCC 7102]TWH43683.1 filamentous hemagglutinin family protein [Dulcicalothrix desertica PCC 7102]